MQGPKDIIIGGGLIALVLVLCAPAEVGITVIIAGLLCVFVLAAR